MSKNVDKKELAAKITEGLKKEKKKKKKKSTPRTKKTPVLGGEILRIKTKYAKDPAKASIVLKGYCKNRSTKAERVARITKRGLI